MGREIRRVVPNWEHPKTEIANHRLGRMEECYQPMHDQSYIEAITEWIKNHQLWEAGEHKDQKNGNAEYRYYAEWHGDAPEHKYYRPNWKPEEMTWYQVYETVSEGTPITPPFATQEELIEYLVASGTFWDEGKKWSRKQAESFVKGCGWVPSLIFTPEHGVQTGVEALEND